MASKRYKKLPEKTKDLGSEPIEKLLSEVKKNCTTKFDESLDLSFQINNKQKKSEVNIRTVVNLPGGTGKNVKVAVVCEENKAQEAKDAGADIVGSDEFVEKIKGGELNFEKLICTPGMMIKLSKLGKVLGPKGIMPNPKTGTVTKDVATAVKNAKAGQIRYRSDKAAIVHGRIGDITYSADQITQNLETLLDDLKRNKPPSAKGVFIQKATLSSTMGAGVEIDLSSLNF